MIGVAMSHQSRVLSVHGLQRALWSAALVLLLGLFPARVAGADDSPPAVSEDPGPQVPTPQVPTPVAPAPPPLAPQPEAPWGFNGSFGYGGAGGDFGNLFRNPPRWEYSFFRQKGSWRFGLGLTFGGFKMKEPYQNELEWVYQG